MTPDTSQRLGAVPLDLAFGDGPRLADQPSTQLSLADLSAQRRRRHPESGCRLSECEHLLAVVFAARFARSILGVVVLMLRDLVAPLAAGAFGGSHLVLLVGAVHVNNVRAIAYIVNRVNA